MAAVVGRYMHRALDLLVLVFAGLGFVYVPLGKHTGYEHAKAIFATGAASRAGRELSDAVDRLRGRVFHDVTRGGDAHGGPIPRPPHFGSRHGRERNPDAEPDPDNARATHAVPLRDLPDASVGYRAGG